MGYDLKIVEFDGGRAKSLSGMWWQGRYEVDAELEYDNDGSTLFLSMEAWRDEGVWRVCYVVIDAIQVRIRGRTLTAQRVYEDAPDKDSWLEPHIAAEFEAYFQNQTGAVADEMAGVP